VSFTTTMPCVHCLFRGELVEAMLTSCSMNPFFFWSGFWPPIFPLQPVNHFADFRLDSRARRRVSIFSLVVAGNKTSSGQLPIKLTHLTPLKKTQSKQLRTETKICTHTYIHFNIDQACRVKKGYRLIKPLDAVTSIYQQLRVDNKRTLGRSISIR